MGIVEAEDDILGGVDFVEDFNHEIFEFVGIMDGGNEAGSVERINLAEFEIVGDFGIGV